MKEETIQALVMKWRNENQDKYPVLKWLHSSINGVKLHPKLAKKCKTLGLIKGIPDLTLVYNNGKYNALYIELKSEKGKLRKEQVEYGEYLKAQGCLFKVLNNVDDTINYIKDYIMVK